eukprot:TRINITY_DN38696_c0_g1_i1.p1 TRINITY_DN38696_c0_g1~~TRINITY_DN38696_c0_g1_i1.p1  ORF type:complete len:249 (+),score=29.52 TRINITY_DN38696_c0_g1_i1:73-819(+)
MTHDAPNSFTFIFVFGIIVNVVLEMSVASKLVQLDASSHSLDGASLSTRACVTDASKYMTTASVASSVHASPTVDDGSSGSEKGLSKMQRLEKAQCQNAVTWSAAKWAVRNSELVSRITIETTTATTEEEKTFAHIVEEMRDRLREPGFVATVKSFLPDVVFDKPKDGLRESFEADHEAISKILVASVDAHKDEATIGKWEDFYKLLKQLIDGLMTLFAEKGVAMTEGPGGVYSYVVDQEGSRCEPLR